MNRQDRAKQFLPFDALKGLREEMKKREELTLRENKRELLDEEIENITKELLKIKKGNVVEVSFFNLGYTKNIKGEITCKNLTFKYVIIQDIKIFFDDIYSLKIVD